MSNSLINEFEKLKSNFTNNLQKLKNGSLVNALSSATADNPIGNNNPVDNTTSNFSIPPFDNIITVIVGIILVTLGLIFIGGNNKILEMAVK